MFLKKNSFICFDIYILYILILTKMYSINKLITYLLMIYGN
jgi:hypothetical protein